MNQVINIPLLTEQVKERLTRENKVNKIVMTPTEFDDMVTREVRKEFKNILNND